MHLTSSSSLRLPRGLRTDTQEDVGNRLEPLQLGVDECVIYTLGALELAQSHGQFRNAPHSPAAERGRWVDNRLVERYLPVSGFKFASPDDPM